MEITFEKYNELKSQKLTRAKIAEYFDIPDWKLKKLIAKNGWGIPRPSISNNSAFSIYDEESCYWAGFIAADGYISDNNDLQICLNYDDLIHLEKFKTFMGSSHKITINTDKYYRCVFGFKSDIIATRLKDIYNITPRKSLIYELPNNIPENYFKDYLRGYFDGDGCISESFSNVNSKTSTIYATITGSTVFCTELYNKLNNLISIQGNNQNRGTYNTIKYNTNSAKKLLDYLYKDSKVYLDRKYNLYNDIVVNNNRKVR